MSLNKIVNLEKIEGIFNYYELPKNKYEGSFIEIVNDKNETSVLVDRFSSIPFYYYVFKNKLYGSSSFQNLIDNRPKDFKITLNKQSCLFFLKTNTFLNQQTLVNEIMRVPYGCSLLFDKRNFKIKIERYWNFSPEISTDSYVNLLQEVNDKFQSAINKCIEGKEKIGINVSGGYDSRQLLGYLIKNKIKFTGYNYGPSNSLDSIVANELSKKHNFKLIYKEWLDIKFYKESFNEYLKSTDNMLAFHHFHPLNILEQQKNEDVILYGHFLDFHSQAWKYEKKYEKLTNKQAGLVIAKDFNEAGHFSVLDHDDETKIIDKKYKNYFSETLKSELDKLDYLPAEKLYDAFYFLHHGTRRLLPQVQAASQSVYYALPGLNISYFDSVWKVPGKFKKNNMMRRNLLTKYYKEVSETRLVRDNQVDYIGKKFGVDSFYKIMKSLKHKKFGVLEADYDFWGGQIYKYIDRDLKSWIISENKNNALLDYDLLNKDEFIKYFERERLPLSSYGTSIVISNFIKNNL